MKRSAPGEQDVHGHAPSFASASVRVLRRGHKWSLGTLTVSFWSEPAHSKIRWLSRTGGGSCPNAHQVSTLAGGVGSGRFATSDD
jgi:hypothetical protein